MSQDDRYDHASEQTFQPTAASSSADGALQQAIRQARSENAERSGIFTSLRAARLCRLDMLNEALRPLVRQIPAEADFFDIGIMPGATPRLFIDMLGFVEMGRDARVYRFVQDRRDGPVMLAQSEDVGTIVDAITDYVARRLIEREKALEADFNAGPSTPVLTRQRSRSRRGEQVWSRGERWDRLRPRRTPREELVSFPTMAFSFLIDLLGAISFFLILGFLAWLIWTRLQGTL